MKKQLKTDLYGVIGLGRFGTALVQTLAEAGKEVIAIYSHNGYQWAKSSDYDSERAAQEMIQSLNSAG